MNHDTQSISQRPERPGMAAVGIAASTSQAWRAATEVLAAGGGQRYPLCTADQVHVADAPPRSASMADHVPLLPRLAT